MINKLEVLNLRKGNFVRPTGHCGTMGWHPKAWVITKIKHKGWGHYQTPVEAWLEGNPNWNLTDIKRIIPQ